MVRSVGIGFEDDGACWLAGRVDLVSFSSAEPQTIDKIIGSRTSSARCDHSQQLISISGALRKFYDLDPPSQWVN